MNSLKNKKIIITGGPTWVPIDSVRVITNVFRGTLGLMIAQEAAKRGAKVTFLLGPGGVFIPKKKSPRLKIIRFKFFDDLYKLMRREISSRKYDVVIQAAAIADYMPVKYYKGKIKSKKENLSVKLKPTIKIIDQVRKWDPKVFLVKFKVEYDISKKALIKKSYESMLASNADLMVANDLKYMKGNKHKAFILDSKKNIIVCNKKIEIAKKLLNTIVKIC